MADELDLLGPSTLSRKKNKKASEDDEVAEILKRRAERAEKETEARRVAAQEDERLLIKPVFSEADKVLDAKMEEVFESQDSLMDDLLKDDGPPPAGYFTFEFVAPTSAAAIPIQKITDKDIVDNVYRSKITESNRASGGEVNFLFQNTLAADEAISSASFDTAMSILTGKMSAFFSSRLGIGTDKSVLSPSKYMDEEWRLKTNFAHELLHALACSQNKNSVLNNPGHQRRLLRLFETAGGFGLVESARALFMLLIRFSCFPKSAGLETEIRTCLRALKLHISATNVAAEDLGAEIALVCLGRFEGDPQAPKADDDRIEDASIHRAVRLGLLLTSAGNLDDYLKSFLQSLTLGTTSIFESFADQLLDEEDATRLNLTKEEWSSADRRVRALFAFMRTDVDKVKVMKRSKVQSYYFNRWHSVARLAEMVATEADAIQATKSFAFKQARDLVHYLDKNFLTAYTAFVEYLRYLKRLLEPYELHRGTLVQTDMAQYFGERDSTTNVKED